MAGGYTSSDYSQVNSDGSRSNNSSTINANGEHKTSNSSGENVNTPVVMASSDSDSSSTKSGISGGELILKDGSSSDVKRDISSETEQSGAINNNLELDKIQAGFAVSKQLVEQIGVFEANKAAEADAAKKALKAADEDPNTDPNSAEYQQLKANVEQADKWQPGGEYGRVISAFSAAATGNVTGGSAQLIQAAAVNYLQTWAVTGVKDFVDDQLEKDGKTTTGEAVRTALQGLVACAGAKANSQNCSAAATGAASSVVINNLIDYANNVDGENLSAAEKQTRKNLVNSLIAGIATAASNTQTAATATGAADMEMVNNKLANMYQGDRMAALAKGDKQKYIRLLYAACALNKCSRGIPKDSKDYQKYVDMEALGNSPELAEDRALLAKQTIDLPHYSNMGQLLSIDTVNLFGYDGNDDFSDKLDHDKVGEKLIGGLQAIGGVVEVYAGGAACATVLGCVIGGPLIGFGADNLTHGVLTSWTGNQSETWGAQLIEKTGASPLTANLIYGGGQIVFGMGPGWMSAGGDAAAAENAAVKAENSAVNIAKETATFKPSVEVPKAPVTGYTKSSLKLGREVHAEYKADWKGQMLNGFEKEFRLDNGMRVDAIDFNSKTVYELKANNPTQIKLGVKQAQGYIDELNRMGANDLEIGTGWKYIIDTY